MKKKAFIYVGGEIHPENITEHPKADDLTIPVGISNRHIHLSREDLDTLFGAGYELTPIKDLSQPGQYACEERVTIVGPKKQLANVSILGPVRPATQVELSATDARSIGISAPVRQSGEIAGSGACKLVGPCGEVEIKEGVIVAKRHIHMTPADAEKLGVEKSWLDNKTIQFFPLKG